MKLVIVHAILVLCSLSRPCEEVELYRVVYGSKLQDMTNNEQEKHSAKIELKSQVSQQTFCPTTQTLCKLSYHCNITWTLYQEAHAVQFVLSINDKYLTVHHNDTKVWLDLSDRPNGYSFFKKVYCPLRQGIVIQNCATEIYLFASNSGFVTFTNKKDRATTWEFQDNF